MSFWTLRVLGYAIWSNQCTRYIPVLHEQYIQGSLKEINLGFLWRHLDLYPVMARAYETPRWGIEHHGGIVIICQRVQVWVWYDRASLLRPHHQCMGVQVYEENIKAIMDWSTPKNMTELRSFFGLCSYYRRFIRGFSQLGAPLTDLTKHGDFI